MKALSRVKAWEPRRCLCSLWGEEELVGDDVCPDDLLVDGAHPEGLEGRVHWNEERELAVAGELGELLGMGSG